MTSRISYSKLRLEDAKHRIAVIILAFFAFFMKELFYFINLQNASAMEGSKNIANAIHRAVSDYTAPTLYSACMIFVMAALFGLNGFRFLHDRSRSDFRLSLPISRSRQYSMIVLNNLMIFLIPCLLFRLVHMGITSIYSPLNHEFFSWMYQGIIADLLCYLLVYFTMVLSVLLTGQTIVGTMAFGVFCLYGPALLLTIVQIYSDSFFETYSKGGGRTMLGEILNDFSTPSLGMKVVLSPSAATYAMAVITIAALLMITYLLYRARPAESAGNALSFRRGRKLIKVLIAVPMALFTGIVFQLFTVDESRLWLYFGVIFGSIIFSGVVEAIIRSDIRGLWAAKKEILVMMVLALLCTAAFQMDIFGYDSYRPDATKVEAVSIYTTYHGNFSSYGDVVYDSNYSDLGAITGEQKDKILVIMNRIMEEQSVEPSADPTIEVGYRLQNKRMVYRKYSVKEDIFRELQSQLFQCEAYKKQLYEIFNIDASHIKSIMVSHPMNHSAIAMTDRETKELYEIYREELLGITYEDLNEHQPVCKLEIGAENLLEDYVNYCIYYVYPSFTNTIEYLQNKGYYVADSPKDETISTLWVSEVDADTRYKITDQDLINSIKDKLYYYDLVDTSNENIFYGINISAEIGDTIVTLATDEDTAEKLFKDLP